MPHIVLCLNHFSRPPVSDSANVLIVITSHLGICCVVKYIRTPSYDYYLSVFLPVACCPLLMLCLFRSCDILSSIVSLKMMRVQNNNVVFGYAERRCIHTFQQYIQCECVSLLLSINEDNIDDIDLHIIGILFHSLRLHSIVRKW